jgi:hypothetical protein
MGGIAVRQRTVIGISNVFEYRVGSLEQVLSTNNRAGAQTALSPLVHSRGNAPTDVHDNFIINSANGRTRLRNHSGPK